MVNTKYVDKNVYIAYIYIYIYTTEQKFRNPLTFANIYIYKLVTVVEGSLFKSYNTEVLGKALIFFLDCSTSHFIRTL